MRLEGIFGRLWISGGEGGLFLSIYNSAFSQVIGAYLNDYTVAWEDADVISAHPSGDMSD